MTYAVVGALVALSSCGPVDVELGRSPSSASAATAGGGGCGGRLGLHVTQPELAIWRQRAVSGPYKSQGDVSPNSVDDWDRVVAFKEDFRTEYHQKIWNDTEVGCVSDYTESLPGYIKSEFKWASMRAMDAAFYALIEQDASIKAMVRDFLLAQSSGIHFGDRSRWCLGVLNREQLYSVNVVMSMLLFAMDYLEILDPEVFTPAERTKLLAWFNGLAEVQYEAAIRGGNETWKDRYAGDYTLQIPNGLGAVPFYGGQPLPWSMLWYNHRPIIADQLLALVGVHQQNASYIDEAKLVVKEFLRFGVHPDGYLGDFDRWADDPPNTPDLGWKFSAAGAGHAVLIADTLARACDTELYDYVTSEGLAGTEGKPKDLRFVVRSIMKYEDGTFERYGTDQADGDGDAIYRVDDKWMMPPLQNFSDGPMLPANMYYRDPYVRGVYTRTGPGTVDFWANYDTQDVNLHYPAPYLMFGQMEDVVWPYPSKSRP